MKNLALGAIAGLLGIALAISAKAEPVSTPDQLIDQLTQVSCNGPGLFNHFPYSDFWAVVPDPHLPMHLEGRRPDCVPEPMRLLVRLGPAALPALLRHVDDARPTMLKVGVTRDPSRVQIGGQGFSEEYESRAHQFDEDAFPSMFLDKCAHRGCFIGRWFNQPYTVRVGDVCFTLIGQIVNRHMIAARYQMTAFIVVNSPVETPDLAERVRSDWTGVGRQELKAALLADLHMPFRSAPPGYKRLIPYALPYDEVERSQLTLLYADALRRLRFYYPETYAGLTGDDLAKRKAFELEEATDGTEGGH